MSDAELVRSGAWINRFRDRNGRAPTVLHIGNIANAAYLNARMLNEAGIASDVLCYEYYHIMGCPEWESAIFDPNGVAPDRPLWSKIDLHGFERPSWFAQGSLDTCIDYLIARRTGDDRAEVLWERMRLEQEGIKQQDAIPSRSDKPDCAAAEIASRIGDLVTAFHIDFPLRSDQPTAEEFATAFAFSETYFTGLRHLCSLYDVVIGYSTDGLIPLAVGKRPYLAYEHGTIRALPFEDNAGGRLCALTYSRADLSFITNCDTVIAAEKLKLADYRFIPHPINEHVVAEPEPSRLRQQLCARLQADFLVFHPARQHWERERHPSWEKGNDIFLEGFARFVRTSRPRAAAVLVEWGKTVAASKALIDELGISDRIVWIPPQNAAGMAAYIQASDVLADQFFLGAWGSTMPRALYLGTPAMIYVNESIHRWCFPEIPPIVNTKSSDAVDAGLCRLLDENYRREISAAGRAWYEKYHSNSVIAESFSGAIHDVLIRTEERQLRDTVRELRDATAICWRLQEAQAEALHKRPAEREIEAVLNAISMELQEIKQQLRATASTVDQIGPMIPNMLRAQRMAHLLLRPPYRALRSLYRLFLRVSSRSVTGKQQPTR
jgi:glycosyltransferase involved in cell wall biosynthesis